MNKVIIMGNLGQDPDVRYMPESGTAVVQLSVATNRSWKDKQTGERKDETSWHRCVCYGKQGENIALYFKKGSKILIEGRLKYGSYEKEGITRYTTDIVVERFEFVEKKSDRDPHAADRDQDGMPSRGRQDADDRERPDPDDSTGEGYSEEDFDDDIPF